MGKEMMVEEEEREGRGRRKADLVSKGVSTSLGGEDFCSTKVGCLDHGPLHKAAWEFRKR